MIRSRVIPCLLLKDHRLVKTIRFRDPRYVGDPVNVVRIFNDKGVDELLLLDISRTPSANPIAFDLVGAIASECFMPLAYGGGIKSLRDIRKLFALGVEKAEHARHMQLAGAGEILINSIDRNGTLTGYDINLVRAVTGAVTIPVIACGGAGRIEDFAPAVRDCGASAVAAGVYSSSMVSIARCW